MAQGGVLSVKRGDFLEKALANLTNEELLLIANKANLHLYARMQQAQHQSEAAAKEAAEARLAQQISPTPNASIFTPVPRF
jgi:uncharacterized protein YaiL (DUF2058 family)